MSSIKTLISQALILKLADVTALKYRAFDVVRLQSSDFQEWELPAVQVIDLGEINIHEVRQAKKQWTLALEVIIGPLTASTPVQTDLWDLMETIENTLFTNPNLGVPGVIHMQLLGSSTDLHFMLPYYLGRIELLVEYRQPLLGAC